MSLIVLVMVAALFGCFEVQLLFSTVGGRNVILRMQSKYKVSLS